MQQRFLSAVVLWTVFSTGLVFQVSAQDRTLNANPELAAYFESQVHELEQRNELTQYANADAWNQDKPKLRGELFDMLGLQPMPEKSDLHATVTGTAHAAEFVVDRVHFQSLPGLYVTGNFYRPKVVTEKLPTILYLCGHGAVKKDGISFGNKVTYQHHGAWFARNGYCCLTIDSLQLGEIEGIHHGTYREGRWWWNSRGYTPAGVEAWNCIRALDYLESRPEVDAARIGATGRSGGGVYSWWIAALDERIACAVPVAGITSLRDHVITGCVEGHCDCMYMLNAYGWDYAKVAALVAPRPLLISNTDKDSIFPLEGVYDIHRQVRHVYRLLDAGDKLGLQITEGPHEDTQELHIHAFRWFNRFLKHDDSLIETTAVPFFEPEQLRVFTTLPSDQINTRIDEVFVPAAEPVTAEQVLHGGSDLCAAKIEELRERCFRTWPDEAAGEYERFHLSMSPQRSDGDDRPAMQFYFNSQPDVRSSFMLSYPTGDSYDQLESIELVVLLNDAADDQQSGSDRVTDGQATFSPRGAGVNSWPADDKKMIQIQRRFQLAGTTLDAMRVWDIRCAIQVLRQECPQLQTLRLRAGSGAESLVLLASLYEPPVTSIEVPVLSHDRDLQPSIFNLTRTIPMDLLPILAASRSTVITGSTPDEVPLAANVMMGSQRNGFRIEFRNK